MHAKETGRQFQQESQLITTVKPAFNGTCMNRNTVHIGKCSWSCELRHNINVNLPGYS